MGPTSPPPHLCRAFPLLLVQMGYGLRCDLLVWRRTTNRRPRCPSVSNPSTSSWSARRTAWRFWTLRQSNGCSTPAPTSSAAKQWTATTRSNYEEDVRLAEPLRGRMIAVTKFPREHEQPGKGLRSLNSLVISRPYVMQRVSTKNVTNT